MTLRNFVARVAKRGGTIKSTCKELKFGRWLQALLWNLAHIHEHRRTPPFIPNVAPPSTRSAIQDTSLKKSYEIASSPGYRVLHARVVTKTSAKRSCQPSLAPPSHETHHFRLLNKPVHSPIQNEHRNPVVYGTKC